MQRLKNKLSALTGGPKRAEAAKLDYLRYRLNLGLARGAAGAATRVVDLRHPKTWEFTGFSQNGEDGIIDVLVRGLKSSNRRFLEIGASDGTENNTTWLAVVKKWSGLMVEGSAAASKTCGELLHGLSYDVDTLCCRVDTASLPMLKARLGPDSPDLFSIDIDSIDYFVADGLFSLGMRPKVCVVEYNSAFGPEHSVCFSSAQGEDLPQQSDGISYYGGVSLGGWRTFFGRHGYRFITVDQSGVNAFFVDPAAFEPDFLHDVQGLAFAENFLQRRVFGVGWSELYSRVSHLDLHVIS